MSTHCAASTMNALSDVCSRSDVADVTASPALAWVVVSDRVGDAKQAIAVGDAIGIPYQVHRAIPVGGSIRTKRLPRRDAIDHLDRALSSSFDAPRPPFIVAIGSWPAAIALCLQRRFRVPPPIILVGRPKPGEFDRFHTIVASSQHLLPRHPKVLRLMVPAHVRGDRERTESSATARCVASRRRPLTAVFIGGPTSPYRFDCDVARDLVSRIRRSQERNGGEIFVVTSPRTPISVTRVLRESAIANCAKFLWGIDAAELNPYQALLSCADRFVVTGDSLSMLVDVAARGRPVAIFDLPVESPFASALLAMRRRIAARARRSQRMLRLVLWLHHRRVLGFPRDLGEVHRALIARGIASRLSDDDPFEPPRACLPDELPRLGRLIRARLRAETTSDRAARMDSSVA